MEERAFHSLCALSGRRISLSGFRSEERLSHVEEGVLLLDFSQEEDLRLAHYAGQAVQLKI